MRDLLISVMERLVDQNNYKIINELLIQTHDICRTPMTDRACDLENLKRLRHKERNEWYLE